MITSHPLRFTFLLVLFCSLAVYLLTLSWHPSGYGDSDEIAIASSLWSVPHPPGYPLQVSLWGLAMRLLTFAEPAAIANLLSAVSLALALAVTASSLLNIFPKSFWSVFTGTLIVGFMAPLWLFSGLSEIFAFALLLVSLFLFFAFRFFQANKKTHVSLNLLLMCFFFGVAVSHLQTVVLLFPAVIYLLFDKFKNRKLSFLLTPKLIISSLLLILLGFLLPNLLLFPLNHHQQPFSWFFEPTLQGWLAHLARRDYAGVFPEEGLVRGAYLLKIDSSLFTNLAPWLQLTLNQLGLLTVLLFLVGFIGLFYVYRRFAWLNLWLVLFPLILFPLLLPIQTNPIDPTNSWLNLAITLRQFLLGYYLIIPSIVFCLWLIFRLPSRFRLANPIISFTLIVMTFKSNYPVGFQRSNSLVSQYAQNVLSTAPPNSLIICTMDISCYSLLYAHHVARTRPDVDIISKTPVYHRYLLEVKPDLYPFVNYSSPQFLTYLVSYNQAKRPVVLTEPTPYLINQLGLNADPFYLIPNDLSFLVATASPRVTPAYSSQNFDRLLIANKASLRDYYRLGLKQYFASIHQVAWQLSQNFGYQSNQAYHADMANQLLSQVSPLFPLLEGTGSATPAAAYLPGSSVSEKNLYAQFQKAFKEEDYQLAYDVLVKLVLYRPLEPKYRALLIYLLRLGGHELEADLEIQNFNRIFPELPDFETYLKTNPDPLLNL